MENVEMWINIVVAIVTGLAAVIPLTIKLVQAIRESVKNKNWATIMQLVLKLMAEAEKNYSTGSEKKKYVIDSIEATKNTLNFDVDMVVIGEMIDSIISASKIINTQVDEKKNVTKK